MNRTRRIAGLVAAVVLTAAVARAADRQVRPFVGTTFAGSTTFVDPENAAGNAHVTIGVNAAVLGEVFGAEVDLGHTFGFFQGDQAATSGGGNLVLNSAVTTVTGNVVIALPRRSTEYSLRLYFVGGGGIMRVREEDNLLVYDVDEIRPAIDFGVGALGFFTNRVGVAWEVRRFQMVGGPSPLTGISFGPEQLSFWRGHMALVLRF